MNTRIKLSARIAISGSFFKIVPYVAAMFFLLFTFSLLNAALNYLFGATDKMILSLAAVISIPVTVGLISPLKLQMQIKHLMLARGDKYCRYEMGISDMLKSCELSVRLFFIKLFWFAVFEAIPVLSGVIFLYHNYYNAVSIRAAYAVLTGVSALAVSGVCFYFVFIQRYSKSWFYLASYKDFSAGDAIKESVRKTQNRCAAIFFFKLSFLPWFLLCIGFLPVLYVVPYYKQSVTCLFLSR